MRLAERRRLGLDALQRQFRGDLQFHDLLLRERRDALPRQPRLEFHADFLGVGILDADQHVAPTGLPHEVVVQLLVTDLAGIQEQELFELLPARHRIEAQPQGQLAFRRQVDLLDRQQLERGQLLLGGHRDHRGRLRRRRMAQLPDRPGVERQRRQRDDKPFGGGRRLKADDRRPTGNINHQPSVFSLQPSAFVFAVALRRIQFGEDGLDIGGGRRGAAAAHGLGDMLPQFGQQFLPGGGGFVAELGGDGVEIGLDLRLQVGGKVHVMAPGRV